MTQEWFESADFEKTANNDKKESPSDPVIPEEELKEKEELPVVEENPQANPEDKETDLEKVEVEEQEELADFWVWLQGALKEPTATFATDKKYSYTAFALLTIFSAISFFCTIFHIKHAYYGHMATIDSKALQQFPSLNLFSIFSILVATSLFFFSILMGGFVVKRFVDQDSDWTLEKAFQEYSRLFAIPILLTGIASFFALFNGLRFAILLCLISIGLTLLANLYVISKPSKDSQVDPFYRLLLAFLVNGGILFLFFLAELALIFDYLRILAFL